MKVYLGIGLLLGSMFSMGCGVLSPQQPAADPSSVPASAPSLTSGQFEVLEIDTVNPYLTPAAGETPRMVNEEPWGPSAPIEPPVQTWGATALADDAVPEARR